MVPVERPKRGPDLKGARTGPRRKLVSWREAGVSALSRTAWGAASWAVLGGWSTEAFMKR